MHTCEVGWNRDSATPTLTGVFLRLGETMLDIKRIRTDFGALLKNWQHVA